LFPEVAGETRFVEVQRLLAMPERMQRAGSSSVRSGVPGEAAGWTGVADFRRRITILRRQPLSWTEELKGGGLIERGLHRLLTRAGANQAQTTVFLNGTFYSEHSGYRAPRGGPPMPDAPRHTGDPTWCVDLLWGAARISESSRVDEGDYAIVDCDVVAANQRSPYGVQRPSGRDLDASLTVFRLEMWWDRRELPIRINTRFTSAVDGGWLWISTEFFDYGVGVDLPTGLGPHALGGDGRVSDA
jgi:hypothetical protein